MVKTKTIDGRLFVYLTKKVRVAVEDILSVQKAPGANGTAVIVTSRGAMRVLEGFDEVMGALYGMDAAAPTNAEGEQ